MRLTRKREDGQYLKTIKSIDECMNKLGQLEDLEEELGVDLLTLFKAIRRGTAYFRGYGRKGFELLFSDYMQQYYLNIQGVATGFIPTKSYGKNWALTEEELK